MVTGPDWYSGAGTGAAGAHGAALRPGSVAWSTACVTTPARGPSGPRARRSGVRGCSTRRGAGSSPSGPRCGWLGAQSGDRQPVTWQIVRASPQVRSPSRASQPHGPRNPLPAQISRASHTPTVTVWATLVRSTNRASPTTRCSIAASDHAPGSSANARSTAASATTTGSSSGTARTGARSATGAAARSAVAARRHRSRRSASRRCDPGELGDSMAASLTNISSKYSEVQHTGQPASRSHATGQRASPGRPLTPSAGERSHLTPGEITGG
jgi:hypothetical protein